MGFDIEHDILVQFMRGEIDRWEAIASLEDELGFSYDEAQRKTLAIQNGGLFSASEKKRKRSKYLGALVNKTFDSPHTGVSTVIVPGGGSGSAISAGMSVLELRNRVNSSNESRGSTPVDKEDYSCWISPQGEIHYLNGGIHYLFLLNNLELFGLSDDFVRSVEYKLAELNGGLSSTDLCDYMQGEAFVRGWTRVRDQRKTNNFSVEFHNPRIAENVLFEWACLMVEKGRGSCEVLIYCWELKERFRYTVQFMASPNEALFQSVRFNSKFIKSSLSGSLDSFLYQNYMAGFGDRNPASFGSEIKDVGDNGKVVLHFETGSGHSTDVDLGSNVDSGYVVESINDELGLFPEGIVEGDLLDKSVVQEIVKSQGERDRQYRKDNSDPPELDGEFVGSSVVPKVSVGDRLIQDFVNEVSAVLRGVDDRFFPKIFYNTAIKQEGYIILFFVAEGQGFKIGVVCGSDKKNYKVMGVSESGKQTRVVSLPSLDSLREWVDSLGSLLRKRR